MNTEISRYLVDANGNSFSSDTDLQSLSKNAKVKNTNSGVSYKKVQGTTSGVPVFDKVPFQEGQPDAVLYSQQSLTTAQKQQARTNIGASGGDAVLYSQQTLTSAEKEQARANIGAIDLATGRDNFVSTTSSQSFDISTTNRILKNIGIQHVTGNSTARGYCSRLAIGNTQLLYGKSSQAWNHGSCRYCSAMFAYPFINDACVLGTPFITVGDDNSTCGVVGYSSSPRTALFGIGSPDHVSYVLYGAIGQSFPLDENASKSSSITAETRNPIWIAKNDINLTVSKAYFLVDMFMPANSDSSDYIEFDSVAPNGNSISSATVEVGQTRLDHHVGYDGTHFTRGFDLDLSSNPDSRYDNVYFHGYSDKSGGKLHVDPELSTYKMRSFVVSVPTSDISSDGNILVYFKFNQSLANGARGFIRVFYIHS